MNELRGFPIDLPTQLKYDWETLRAAELPLAPPPTLPTTLVPRSIDQDSLDSTCIVISPDLKSRRTSSDDTWLSEEHPTLGDMSEKSAITVKDESAITVKDEPPESVPVRKTTIISYLRRTSSVENRLNEIKAQQALKKEEKHVPRWKKSFSFGLNVFSSRCGSKEWETDTPSELSRFGGLFTGWTFQNFKNIAVWSTALLPVATFVFSYIGSPFVLGIRVASAMTFAAMATTMMFFSPVRVQKQDDKILKEFSRNLALKQCELAKIASFEREQRELLRDFRKIITRELSAQEMSGMKVKIISINDNEAVQAEIAELCRNLCYESRFYEDIKTCLQDLQRPSKTDQVRHGSKNHSSPRAQRAERRSRTRLTTYLSSPPMSPKSSTRSRLPIKLGSPTMSPKISPRSTGRSEGKRFEALKIPEKRSDDDDGVSGTGGGVSETGMEADIEDLDKKPAISGALSKWKSAVRRTSPRGRLEATVREALAVKRQEEVKTKAVRDKWKSIASAVKPGRRFHAMVTEALEDAKAKKRVVRVVILGGQLLGSEGNELWAPGEDFVALLAEPEELEQIAKHLGVYREGEFQERLKAKGISTTLLSPLTVEALKDTVRTAMHKHLADEYLLIKVLGRGATGTVYKTRRVRDDQMFAIKEINYKRMSKSALAEAEAEAEILGKLKWPTVLSLVDSWRSDVNRIVYLLMPILDGGNLDERFKISTGSNCTFSYGQFLGWYLQSLHGLTYMHSQGILHRDIKPANFFLSASGRSLRIGDLGSARRLSGDGPFPTPDGCLDGSAATRWYAGPEVVEGTRHYSASDVFSCGASFVDLLALHAGFAAEAHYPGLDTASSADGLETGRADIAGFASGSKGVDDSAQPFGSDEHVQVDPHDLASRLIFRIKTRNVYSSWPSCELSVLIHELSFLVHWNYIQRPLARDIVGKPGVVSILEVIFAEAQVFVDDVLLQSHLNEFSKLWVSEHASGAETPTSCIARGHGNDCLDTQSDRDG